MRSVGCTSATSNSTVAVGTQPQSRVQQCCNRKEGIVMWGVVEIRSPTTPQQQQCSVRLARHPNSAKMQIAVSDREDESPRTAVLQKEGRHSYVGCSREKEPYNS